MAAEYFGGVGEKGQFLETLYDRLVIATFEVGASATATEKGVAREKHIVYLGIETDAATGVPRGGDHL